MSDEELQAFEAGTGGMFTVSDFSLFMAGTLASVLFIWLAWVAVKAYHSFSVEDVKLEKAGGLVIRAVLVVTILLFIIT